MDNQQDGINFFKGLAWATVFSGVLYGLVFFLGGN